MDRLIGGSMSAVYETPFAQLAMTIEDRIDRIAGMPVNIATLDTVRVLVAEIENKVCAACMITCADEANLKRLHEYRMGILTVLCGHRLKY
jgi:hypothetical protein